MNKLLLFISSFALISGIYAQELSSYIDFGTSSPNVQKARLAVDSDGNIIHANYVSSYVDADPGAGVYMINPGGETGIAITKFNPENEFLWAIFFPFASYTFMDINTGPDNSIFFGGTLAGSTDIDPGVGETIIDAGTGSSNFIAKFSSEGEFVWVSASESDESSNLYDLCVLSDGSVASTGYFQGATDFDPGAGEYIVDSNESFIGSYIWKLNPNGEFEWIVPYYSESIVYGKFITSDLSDNILVRGEFGGQIDLDPGDGEYILDSGSDTQSSFIAKYTSSGELSWGFFLNLNMSFSEESSLIQTDTEGNVILSGLFLSGEVDFDPGAGEVFSTQEFNSQSCFIAKYSPEGEYIWHKEGTGLTHHTLGCDAENNIYVTGMCDPNADADHGYGVSLLNENSDSYLYCAKYNSLGQLLWAFDLFTNTGSLGLSWTTSMAVRPGEMIITGLYQEALDLDPGAGTTMLNNIQNSAPAFIAVYSEGPCANVSLNISEVLNIDCTNIQGAATVEFVNGIEPYSFEWNTEETTATIYPETAGIYTVTGEEGGGCVENISVLLNGPAIQDGFDLNPNVIAFGFSPGFSSTIQVDAFNDGCASTDGTLVLTLDPVLSILNVSPEADIVDGNVLTWNFTALAYDSDHLTPQIDVITPASTELGEIIDIHVAMNPSSGDYNPINNEKDYTYEVIGSYDPNAKQVYPQGTGPEGYIVNNQTMTYTVQFQNTGTAPAVNVYILDLIEENLDISTVQVIASSHPMYTQVLDNNMLKFAFDNIMLPDSTSNEPESHGYVVFTIEQQANLPAYTEIENTAAIYFDFNEPIITNTVLNTISGSVGVDEKPLQVFHSYPNPALDRLYLNLPQSSLYSYKIISSEGKTIGQGTNVSITNGIDVSQLPSALYQIVLTDNEGEFVCRFMKR